MLYQTQSEINTFSVRVIQRVAASPKVAIQDLDMKSTDELLEEIRLTTPQVFSALESFLKAHQTWYEVHVAIEQAGTAGNLTPQQSAQLNASIASRDSTRKALLQAL